MRRIVTVMLTALGIMMLPSLAAANSVNTFPTWNGTSTICCMGSPQTPTYGETIVSPGGNLQNFSFWLSGPAGFEFNAYVGTWNPVMSLVQSVLFTSPVTTLTASDQLQEFTVGGLNLPTIAGQSYIFIISIDSEYAQDAVFGDGAATMGGSLSGANPTFSFAFSNNMGNSTLWFSNWNFTGCGAMACGQAAFLANFASSPTPEPSSLLLLGTGLLSLGLSIRRATQS